MNPIYMIFVIPLFFLSIAVEYFIAKRKSKAVYRLSDTITNLNIGIGNQAFSLVFKGLIGGVFIYVYDEFRLLDQAISVGSLLLCVVLFDFLFYWAHRWSHEVNFLWAAHVVHHQSEDYNLGVALRQSWFHNLLAFFIFLPIPLLGFRPEVFFPAAGIHTLYQFWIHTKLVNKLPNWIEYIMNTPSHHRVHHGRNIKYLDKNHGGIFIIWDRLFGTFQEEIEEPIYGITVPLNSYNPLWSNVEYFDTMLKQAKQTNNTLDKLHTLVAKPGWRPAELGGYIPPDEPSPDTIKYDTNTQPAKSKYVLAQFILIVLALIAYMLYFDELTVFFQLIFLIILITSTVICGAIFENKSWVKNAEIIRLLIVAISLNGLYVLYFSNWFITMLICSTLLLAVFIVWLHISWKKDWLLLN